jgi:hypothetical protein
LSSFADVVLGGVPEPLPEPVEGLPVPDGGSLVRGAVAVRVWLEAGLAVFVDVEVDVFVGAATGTEERPLDVWPPDENRVLTACFTGVDAA